MSRIFPLKIDANAIKSLHFWAIVLISLALLVIYQAWPWRPWNLETRFYWLLPLQNIALVELRYHIIGILFLIPMIYATIVFSWPGTLLAYLIALAGVLPIAMDILSTSSLITNMLLLVLPLFVVILVAFELEWRRKERKSFAERERERLVYISRMLESQENERRRIAQELHDETIQTLLVIANRAQNLISPDSTDPEKIAKNAEWIRDATLKTVDEMRRISLDLRPSILDDLGLVPALRWLVDRMNRECNISTRILVKGVKRKLSPQAEAAIFRIVQEALNNIRRHSGATQATVTLEFADDYLKMRVEDNGQGFCPPKKLASFASKDKLGLIGIQQRIDFLGGTLQIRSRPGGGTVLLIEARC